MDVPEAEVEENVDYTFLHFIYGFLALLGICILFSLGKAIYHYYKIRDELNVATTENSIDTESNSLSSVLSIGNELIENNANEHTENNVPESDRLNIQLDKLRKLLNRLNAMGTFSRDTIGDLSAQSAVYLNNSRAASSDLSEFWSSIDFDDLDESTINEGTFFKPPTEKSVSLSVSDFSLDTSGLHFNNFRQKNIIGSSNENVPNTSVFNSRTNPSDAIAQILVILDSIILKNRPDAQSLVNTTLKNETSSNESINIKTLSQSVHSVESYQSQKPPILSPCSEAVNEKLPSTIGTVNWNTLIDTSGYKQSEILNSGIKYVGNMMTYEPKLFQQTTNKVTESEYKMSSGVSMAAKITKGISVVNISSSSESKSFPSKISSKSLDTRKFPISQSVSICIDPFTKVSNISSLESSASRVSHIKRSTTPQKILSETGFKSASPCKLNLEGVKRSHSFSNLLDKKLQFLSIQPQVLKLSSEEKEEKISDSEFGNISQIAIANTKMTQNPQYLPTKNSDVLNKSSIKAETSMLQKKKLSAISYRSLYSPVSADTLIFKSSLSESEIKQSQSMKTFSPTVSSSGSETFLSPIIFESPYNFDWKSPENRISNIYLPQNLTPHSENTMLSKNLSLWYTPPSPTENNSDDVMLGKMN